MYELLYIIPAKYTEQEVLPIIEKIGESIKKYGAEIISTENLEKKKLAYPIKQNFRGYYVFNKFNAAPEKLQELNKELRLNSEILKFLITKFEEIKEKPRKKAKPESKKKKITTKELDDKLEEILKVE